MRYVDLGTIKKPREKSKKRFFLFIPIAIILIVLIVFPIKNIFKSFSVLSQITSNNSLQATDGRTNILILGLDKRAPQYLQTGILTDTIIVISVGKTSSDIKIISIPRDLWVKIKDGQFSKINEVYVYGGGPETVAKVAGEVLGIPIHYFVVVGFDGFKDFVSTLGGVSVTVENTLDDYLYPIEGKEQDNCGLVPENLSEEEIQKSLIDACFVFECRCEHVHIEKGEQVLDGETALKFVRSRHGENGEGSDFARAKRQQILIIAVKNKLLTMGVLTNPIKVKELYDLYKKYVITNIGIGEIDEFYNLSKNLNMDNIKMAVLNNGEDESKGGLFFTPQNSSLYGEKWVLIPRSGDFSQTHSFVQKFLFSD